MSVSSKVHLKGTTNANKGWFWVGTLRGEGPLTQPPVPIRPRLVAQSESGDAGGCGLEGLSLSLR
eukprot:753418-Hanusia_phi.AAC.2